MSKYHFDIALSIALIATLLLHYTGIIGVAGTYILIAIGFIGVLPVLWGAYRSLQEREWASMDMLASIALVFSILSRQWPSAVFIELMLAAARILDSLTHDRTEQSIRGLLKLRPNTAEIVRGDKLVQIPTENIRVGDVVVVDIEERIPVDGTVVSGTAAVDESSLTGESLPIDKHEGSRVMSSTLVQSGSLRIKTTQVGEDTTLERIIKLVESAREEKPTTQTLGEKFGKAYLISIFFGSILLYIFTHNLSLVLAVVLVVCADDIAIAIPIAYLRAISLAAKIGVIVKGSRHLEALEQMKTVVFDKTGTLTVGKLTVTEIVPTTEHAEEEVLRIATIANIRSNHPLSKAIMNYAKQRSIPEVFPDSSEEKGGKGVVVRKGKDTIAVGKRIFIEELGITLPPDIAAAADQTASEGKSISFIAKNNQVLGFAAAADTVKKNAKAAIASLRSLGVEKIVMLTGDNSRAAAAIAKDLGIDEWHADLLPEHKVDIIKKLQQKSPVAMVGDGINDAAALSIASIGIAMGGLGTEGTIESAQIVLMRDDLSTLSEIMRIARKTRRISIEDFWIWGITNAAGLALVFGGIIGPAGAAAYNFLSDFLPLFNSVRVKTTSKKKT